MLLALVAERVPACSMRARAHRRVLALVIVVQSRRTPTGFSQDAQTTRGQRIVWPACEIPFLHSDIAQHRFGEHDVLWLSAMRSASKRELIVAPAERVEPAGR